MNAEIRRIELFAMRAWLGIGRRKTIVLNFDRRRTIAVLQPGPAFLIPFELLNGGLAAENAALFRKGTSTEMRHVPGSLLRFNE